MPTKRAKKIALTEVDLTRWQLVVEFEQRLVAATEDAAPAGTWADPKRRLSQNNYLSLVLFGLLNPVVESMRGLCAASHLRRVQEDICEQPVSLGSFSEAQAAVDPELLQKVFADLAAEHRQMRGDERLAAYAKRLIAIDGTLWAALPRMAWALWRWQHGAESALKAHVKFNVLEEKPVGVTITRAKRCERAVLRECWVPGEFYVGDRYYGEDYGLFGELRGHGCSFVLRLRQEACWTVEEEFALIEADRAAGITFDGMVRLGKKKPQKELMRLVRIQTQDSELLLVTDQPRAELSAELIGEIYRCRWRIELFFKWLKCILGCRHWLAETPQGVAIQVYCALIAALLLLRATGKRPNKRAMEMIRFYLVGYASLDELSVRLEIEKNRG